MPEVPLLQHIMNLHCLQLYGSPTLGRKKIGVFTVTCLMFCKNVVLKALPRKGSDMSSIRVTIAVNKNCITLRNGGHLG